MSSDLASAHVIAPRQQRSTATLRCLLDAAEELLAERSLEHISVTNIVARARSWVGSFYARFPTKDDLLAALLEQYHEEVAAVWSALVDDPAWHDFDLRQRTRVLVGNVIRHCRRRRGLLRLRLRRRLGAAGPDPGTVGEPARDKRMVTELARLFASCSDEIRRPDPDAALLFALRLIDSTATASIAIDDVLESYGVVDDTALAEQLTVAFVAYLRTR